MDNRYIRELLKLSWPFLQMVVDFVNIYASRNTTYKFKFERDKLQT